MNIGDKVKIIKSPYKAVELQAGNTGVIVSFDGFNYDINVGPTESDIGRPEPWPFHEHELEVVNE